MGDLPRAYRLAARGHGAVVSITSNLNFTEWPSPIASAASATLDRLRYGVYRLILDGNSYRSSRPLPGEYAACVQHYLW